MTLIPNVDVDPALGYAPRLERGCRVAEAGGEGGSSLRSGPMDAMNRDLSPKLWENQLQVCLFSR
jgi:hypothetical protein